MKAQMNTNETQRPLKLVPSVAGSMGHILALGGLEERGTVAHIQNVVAKLYPETFALKALDLNSGRGIAAMTLAELGFKVAAFDVNRSSISVIQKLAMKEELNISFRVGGLPSLVDFDEKFDLIHDRDVLTHITGDEKRAEALRAIKYSLALGGKFILTSEILVGPFDADLSFESIMLDQSGVLWRQTPDSDVPVVKAMDGKFWTAVKQLPNIGMLRAELMNAGFKVILEEQSPVVANGICQARFVLTHA